MTSQPAPKPLAVYTDTEDTDVTAGVDLLERAGFEVRLLNTRDPREIAEQARDAVALLPGYAVIDAAALDRLPRLRIIALMSMGFNNVDLEAATHHGVWVTNVPHAASEEVATHTLALALALVRDLDHYRRAAEEGDWNGRGTIAPPRLSGETLGILGLGAIGRRFAELAQPIFGSIVGYDPFLPNTEQTRAELSRIGVRRTTLEEVRGTARILSLHVPLTAETHGIVDREFLALMPRASYLLNVSRGQLVDVEAIRSALDEGHLAGAGLDVLDEEPPPGNHPLLGHPRVLLTPHVAYYSATTETEYPRIQAQNAVSWLVSGHPDTPLNDPSLLGA